MTSSSYFNDQLATLKRLMRGLDPQAKDVCAARQLIARYERNPSLWAAPLARRRVLYDVRRLTRNLRTLHYATSAAPKA